MRSLTTLVDALQYFLSSIAVFLGLVIGIVIANYTKEELVSGRKYFILIQRLLVLIITCFFLYSFHVRIYVILIALFLVSTGMYQLKIPLFVYYVIFGFLFFFSPELLNLAGLMFLFGLPSGALIEKDVKKNLLLSCLFFVPIILFYVIRLFLI
jgi:hypothetical protein